jgi:2-iminobutanoate/2-iminopropanoate deaminase
MPKIALSHPDIAAPAGVFAQATMAPASGQLVFVSGLTARDMSGGVIGVDDVRVQTRVILDNMKRILNQAGGTFDDVTRVTVYVTNLDRDFAAIHEVRAEYFKAPLPASTLVEVSRLVLPEMLVEIEAIAVVATDGTAAGA